VQEENIGWVIQSVGKSNIILLIYVSSLAEFEELFVKIKHACAQLCFSQDYPRKEDVILKMSAAVIDAREDKQQLTVRGRLDMYCLNRLELYEIHHPDFGTFVLRSE